VALPSSEVSDTDEIFGMGYLQMHCSHHSSAKARYPHKEILRSFQAHPFVERHFRGLVYRLMRTRTELLMIKRFLIFGGLWLALTGGRIEGLLFGAAAAGAALLISVKLAPPSERRLRLLALLRMAPGFLVRSFAGGADVAGRVFHPRLPMKPGWIRYSPKVPAGAPRVFLGGEISLLPGTLVAGEQEGCLLVHCLDTEIPVAQQIADEEEKIAGAVG
jgi:multicomponent Na+:H+ antiporter subunit E